MQRCRSRSNIVADRVPALDRGLEHGKIRHEPTLSGLLMFGYFVEEIMLCRELDWV